MEVAYSNGNVVSPDVDTCGYPLLYPVQDDPVQEKGVGTIGEIIVVFKQGGTEKGRAVTNKYGYFVAILEEGTYDVEIRDDNYEDFDAQVTLSLSGSPQRAHVISLGNFLD